MALAEAIRNSQGMQRVQEDVEAHKLAALAALNEIPSSVEKQALSDLADYVVARLL
jgi:geranylgeranyl pyrophosphate synthase